MNRYPLWQYILLIAILAAGLLYALPNVFGQQPAIQISALEGHQITTQTQQRVKSSLEKKAVPFDAVEQKEDHLVVLFEKPDPQIKAAEVLDRLLGDDYVVSPALAPRTPAWLTALGAKPMSLGLDLRGGVHFLIAVDMDTVFKNTYERYARDIPKLLRDKSIHYSRVWPSKDHVNLKFSSTDAKKSGLSALRRKFDTLNFEQDPTDDRLVKAKITDEENQRLSDFAVEKNITTLRNRVNELGVSEALVQRQGKSRIVVELPGVQDTAQAKRLLGKTATLEYHLVAQGHDPEQAERTGRIPAGTELYHTRDGRPILLNKDVIASGDQLEDASAGRDQKTGQPNVSVKLGGTAADNMRKTTAKHVGDPMAVLFIENKIESHYENGHKVTHRKTEKTVISVATIQGVFGSRFQTSGLSAQEASDLALLLRSGALAAPVEIVSERTIGPSLGADNIQKGKIAVIAGFLLVVGFMLVYYRVFGLLANAALFMNLILLVAVMSLLQATLTLPGIAGIVLTLGMAVDANVLIFERIREELNEGNSPQMAIHRGYDRAFSSIADGQLTTLVAAIVLFAFGTGPIKGFAVTLSIGIMSSLYTSIVGTRAIANLVYGRRKKLRKISI